MSKKNKEPENEIPPQGKNWLIGRQDEEFTYEEQEILSKVSNKTYMILAIYDIVDDKKRLKLSKVLLGYGERVQRSAFECHLTLRQYEEMIKKALPFIDEEKDLLRIYKLTGNASIKVWGKIPTTEDEEVVII